MLFNKCQILSKVNITYFDLTYIENIEEDCINIIYMNLSKSIDELKALFCYEEHRNNLYKLLSYFMSQELAKLDNNAIEHMNIILTQLSRIHYCISIVLSIVRTQDLDYNPDDHINTINQLESTQELILKLINSIPYNNDEANGLINKLTNQLENLTYNTIDEFSLLDKIRDRDRDRNQIQSFIDMLNLNQHNILYPFRTSILKSSDNNVTNEIIKNGIGNEIYEIKLININDISDQEIEEYIFPFDYELRSNEYLLNNEIDNAHEIYPEIDIIHDALTMSLPIKMMSNYKCFNSLFALNCLNIRDIPVGLAINRFIDLIQNSEHPIILLKRLFKIRNIENIIGLSKEISTIITVKLSNTYNKISINHLHMFINFIEYVARNSKSKLTSNSTGYYQYMNKVFKEYYKDLDYHSL